MSAGEYCNREVVVADKAESVREAIRLMRSNHVGDVVVVEQQGDVTVPLGILTDRDIVIEILAEEVEL
ncbi:MAG: CBS domain-containing protein, partial [Granulosicoccaceae bacterium]